MDLIIFFVAIISEASTWMKETFLAALPYLAVGVVLVTISVASVATAASKRHRPVAGSRRLGDPAAADSVPAAIDIRHRGHE